MDAIASQITSLTDVYSNVYSGADQSKHQSYASLAFVWGIHRRPVNSPHKWPVTRKMFPFDDVIMWNVGWNDLSISKLQRLRWNLGMDKYFHPTFYNGCNYLIIFIYKLIYVNKMVPGSKKYIHSDNGSHERTSLEWAAICCVFLFGMDWFYPYASVLFHCH